MTGDCESECQGVQALLRASNFHFLRNDSYMTLCEVQCSVTITPDLRKEAVSRWLSKEGGLVESSNTG